MDVLKALPGGKVQSHIETSMFILEISSQKCFWSQSPLLEMEPPKKGESLENFFTSVLHQDDVGRFIWDYHSVTDGTFCSCANIYRMRNARGCFQNVNVKLRTIGEDGKVSRQYVIGIIDKADCYSNIDPVTMLPNNYSFRKYLSDKTGRDDRWAVIMLGIDDFSNINELYSYSTGSLLLHDCAGRIRRLLPESASLFRLDGDGFGIVLPDCDEEEVKKWYTRLKKSCIAEKFSAAEYKFLLTISGGACCYPKDGKDYETIYRNADKALQTSKKNGKNCLVVYSEDLAEKDKRRAALLSALRESVVLGFKGFYMVYQPIVNAQNQQLVGSEALLRWNNPDFPQREEISPVEFIPILEENGLMLEMGRWVLETAIRQCAQWCRYKPDFQMNINVSSLQFEVSSFKYLLMDMLSEYKVHPANITLELTESGKVKDPFVLSEQFDFIRGQGIHIALDDFGTGYSSLEVLRLLSADELKIDRSFLERISYDVTDQALLSTLVSLSRNMNMEVCVEGIENSKMEEHVCRLNPDLLQGYFYSHPLSVKDFEAKYFSGIPVQTPANKERAKPEHSQSLVYASFRPAQSMKAQEMIDNAYAGIFQVGMDEEFSLLTCNEGYRRMLGYTAQEMEKKFKNQALGLVHPDDIEFVNNDIRRQLGESDTVTIEFRVVRKDGTPIWIVGTGNVHRSADGTTSLVVVIINNDANKRRQLAREKDYAAAEKLMANLPTGVKCVRFDADFTIDYISKSMLNLTGYTREDIRQLFDNKYINLIHEDDRALVTNDILEQLKVSNIVTMRYRSPCKDGRLIWLETISKLCEADEDGIQRAYSMVMDITDSGEEEEDRGLRITNRYEMVAEQLGEYFMEYDFASDKLAFSDNFNRVFGYQGNISFAEVMTRVHEEDVPDLMEGITAAKNGIRPDPVELRLFIPGKEYHWFSVTMMIPEKFGDKPMTVMAKLTDIDEEKRELEQLRIKSQRDSTTNLLNKASTEERIRAALGSASSEEHYAFFMIDVDHFKKVNDTYGHFTGDEVLRNFARRIKSHYRKEDIIGRVGGDEFLAFMPYSGNMQEIISKAEALVDILHQPINIDDETVRATVSIGVSCYPEDGEDFYSLYRRADSALYRRKSMNRDGFCLAARFEPTAE